MKNWNMAKKLGTAFGALIGIFVIVGALGVIEMLVASTATHNLANVRMPQLHALDRLNQGMTDMMLNMRLYDATLTPEYLAKSRASASELARHLTLAQDAARTGPRRDLQNELDLVGSEYSKYSSMLGETSETVAQIHREGRAADSILAGMEKAMADRITSETAEIRRRLESGAPVADAAQSTQRLEALNRLKDAVARARATTRSGGRDASAALAGALTGDGGEAGRALSAPYRIQAEEFSDASDRLESLGARFARANDARKALADGIVGRLRKVTEAQIADISSATARNSAELKRGIALMAAGGAIVLILGFFASARLSRMISDPLAQGVSFANAVAEGDFTRTMDIDQEDEVGQLAKSLNKTVGNLRGQTHEILEGVGILAASVNSIVASTSQLAAGSMESAASISQTTTTVEEVRQTANLSSDKARSVSELSLRVTQASAAGQKAANSFTEGMVRIRGQMDVIAASITRLSENGREIADIIASVDDLSEQSNILAVNAAIEAARAGEHGRGFSVVAQEIRSLAEQSKRSTGQVRKILGDIQKYTATAVLTVEQGARTVDDGVKQSQQAAETIQTLVRGIGEASQATTQIAVMSQQQLIGMDQVAIAMESINEASSQNADSMKQLEAAAQDLKSLGERLHSLVLHYKV